MVPGITKSTIHFITESGNRYLYDRQLKTIVFCHPILYALAQMEIHKENIEFFLHKQKDELIDIPVVGMFLKKDVLYYYKRMLLLKEAGFFSEINQSKELTRELNAEIIKVTLANLVQVTFELSDACQMACYYCGYGRLYDNYDNRENRHMTFSTIKKTLDYLNALMNTSLNNSHERPFFIGFYGGEPLLDFDLITRTVAYSKKLVWRHNTLRFAVTTNGLLLDKYMEFIVQNDINLFISLDGDEKSNAYRVLRNGKSVYKKVEANVEMLKTRHPDFYKKCVFFNAVLHNKNSVEEIYRFFKDKFAKEPSILTLNTNGIRKNLEEEFWKTFKSFGESLSQSKIHDQIEQELFIKSPTVQTLANYAFNTTNSYYQDYNSFYDEDNQMETRFPSDTCVPFSKKLFVTVNGKILPCERIGQQFELGRITPAGVYLDFKKIAKKYNAWYSIIKKQCQYCYIYDRCTQCIFNLDLKSGHLKCDNYQNEAQFALLNSRILSYFEKKPNLFNRILKEVLID